MRFHALLPLIGLASAFPPTWSNNSRTPNRIQALQEDPAPPSSPTPAASPLSFSATSHQNLAVYYGKTDLSVTTDLTTICQDPSIDIVILGFLLNILGPGGLPTMALNNTNGELCEGPNASMLSAGGTNMRRCEKLEQGIKDCQAAGRKIFISVGGAKGTQFFSSQAEAETAATVLWDLFGHGTGLNKSLRPFGESTTVDGFDIDNETTSGNYWPEMAAKLRQLTNSQNEKKYFLSAAPACYFPTPAAPLQMLQMVDFVWPQFYGAPSCNLGSSNFFPSISAWADRLKPASGPRPKLYIGGASWDGGAKGGYVPAQELNRTIVETVDKLGTERFGGVMLWDAAYGVANVDAEGRSIVEVAKESLLV